MQMTVRITKSRQEFRRNIEEDAAKKIRLNIDNGRRQHKAGVELKIFRIDAEC